MTCIDFINSIGIENIKTLIGNYFDQTMALYKICGTSNFSSINSIIDENNMIRFELVFDNNNDLVNMENLLSITNNCIIYGIIFEVYYEKKDNNIINIMLKSATP